MQTLQAYLSDAHARHVIDHSIRARVGADGAVVFYIHPAGADGQTLDFLVNDNTLTCIASTGPQAVALGAANVT